MRLETAQVLGKRKAMLRKIELFKTLPDDNVTHAAELLEELTYHTSISAQHAP